MHETRSGIYKLITSQKETTLLDTNKLGFIGHLDKFQVDDKSIILDQGDNTYLYSLKNKNLIKIHENNGHNFAYSKKYKKIIFEKKEVLYQANIDGSNIERIGDIAVSAFFYNNIVFIDEDTFLYQTFSKSNKRVVTKYSLKDNIKQVAYEVFAEKNCFPSIYLSNGNFICHDASEGNQGLYTLDIKKGTINKLSIEPSGKYLYYMKDLNAVFYMKEGFNFLDGVIFKTRIYFLDKKEDFLWSERYLQPIEFL